MRKTEKKYWVNGYKTMGVNFHTLAFQFLGLGILICWRLKPNAFTNKRYFNFEMFNLIK